MISDAVKRLATVVSPAARIEPELLRAARLRLFPDMDVSAEGDLWFSDLVASRSSRRIVLDPEIASSLRQSLGNDQELLKAARDVVVETHRHAPPAIQLEEEIVYLALTGANVEEAINTKLTSVLSAIVNEGRLGLIDWAARALPAMPAIVQNTPAAAALRLIVGGAVSEAVHVSVGRDPAIAALVGRALPKTKVFARLVPQQIGLGVEISRAQLPASHEIELPKTEPLMLELITRDWPGEDGEWGTSIELVEIPREGTLLREIDRAFSIRTMVGDVFVLKELPEEERTTLRILVITSLAMGKLNLPDEPDIDLVLIAGDVAERGTEEEYWEVAGRLRERFGEMPVLAVPGPGDPHDDAFIRFLARIGFTTDRTDFAKTLQISTRRIGVVGIDTSLGEFAGSQIFNACGGDALAWAHAHDAAILITYNAPEHLDHEARERWEAFGTEDVFDFIATGSANTPPLAEGYVVVELPDPDSGALVSIHRHDESQIRRQTIHPRLNAMPPAPPRRVLIAGSAEGLSIPLQEFCRAIGSLLALQGHDLLTGGWPGVDFLVAEGFDKAAPHRVESLTHYFGGLRKEPDFKRGRPVFSEREEDSLRKAVSDADVVILIEGARGTRSVGSEAILQGKPVIPIGGGAAQALRPLATRPGRWSDAAAALLRRLDRVPIWQSQGFVEGLPDTLPEQASIAAIVHDVNELLPSAHSIEIEREPAWPQRGSVFLSAGGESPFVEELRAVAEPFIADTSDFWYEVSSLLHARFAVVFISPRYVEDRRCRDELRSILERAWSGELTIFWFLETVCDYASTGIDSFMAAHDVTRPLDTLSYEERQEVFHSAAGQLSEQLRSTPWQERSSELDDEDVTAVDFLILTTLPEEREAVRRKLNNTREVIVANDVQPYHFSTLPITFAGREAHYRVVLTSLPIGSVDASVAAVNAIERLNPRGILFVGIATGIEESGVTLGDIVVADHIVQFETGRGEAGGRSIFADASLLAAAQALPAFALDVSRPDKRLPSVHVGPVGTADIIFSASVREPLTAYRRRIPNLAAVEMGSGAVLFQIPTPRRFLVIRGIADLGTGSKTPAEWRDYATDAAATFAVALLKSGPSRPAKGMETVV